MISEKSAKNLRNLLSYYFKKFDGGQNNLEKKQWKCVNSVVFCLAHLKDIKIKFNVHHEHWTLKIEHDIVNLNFQFSCSSLCFVLMSIVSSQYTVKWETGKVFI